MKKIPTVLFVLLSLAACKKDAEVTSSTNTSTDGTTTNNFSRLYKKMYNITSIDTSGTANVIIKTTDLPDHKSPFFGVGNAKYEAYNGDNPNFSTKINLNGTINDPTLLSQSLTFTLPRYPAVTSNHVSTTGGPIGIGRNGVVFFNQYNGANAALDELEINNADQYLGHPTPSAAGAQYHYHYEPKYLTTKFGNSSFMGFLLDGFPVYGPYENGVKITTSMLDSYNGHVSATEDFPNDKIYHYHVISATSSKPTDLKLAAPYINGGKYYGTKGTVN
ncbi:YHYH protein [Spirosoma gilvum]